MVSQRPKRILIVEDEPDIAQLVRHYLEKEGFHPCLAKTGLEALKLVSSEHPDLVILDLMLASDEWPRGLQGATPQAGDNAVTHHHADGKNGRVRYRYRT